MLRDHPARWMLWEGQPEREAPERLRALGVENLVLNPCASRPETGNFPTVTAGNATDLERAYRP